MKPGRVDSGYGRLPGDVGTTVGVPDFADMPKSAASGQNPK
jgi:hypothetical protein